MVRTLRVNIWSWFKKYLFYSHHNKGRYSSLSAVDIMDLLISDRHGSAKWWSLPPLLAPAQIYWWLTSDIWAQWFKKIIKYNCPSYKEPSSITTLLFRESEEAEVAHLITHKWEFSVRSSILYLSFQFEHHHSPAHKKPFVKNRFIDVLSSAWVNTTLIY